MCEENGTYSHGDLLIVQEDVARDLWHVYMH